MVNTTLGSILAGFTPPANASCDTTGFTMYMNFYTIILWLGKTNKANFLFAAIQLEPFRLVFFKRQI
jgi:hypothetical protein